MLKIYKIIDKYLFRSFVLHLLSAFGMKRKNSESVSGAGKNRRIVFLRPGKLGDMIVATPFFSQLKKTNPELHLSVICSPGNKIIIKHNPYIDEIKAVNFHSVFAVLALVRWIRKKRFDWVIDLIPEVSRTSTLIMRMVRSSDTRTAGMHKGDVSRFYDVVTDYSGIHITERYKLLIETVLNCRLSETVLTEVHVLPKHIESAEHIIKEIDKSKIIVGINCSAGKIERQWDRKNYHALLKSLHAKYDNICIILFSVGEQQAWAEEFSKEFKNTKALTNADFFTVAAVMKHLSLFFSPDTALIHIASGNGCPIVGLYCTDGENLVRWRACGHNTIELVAKNSHNVNEISSQDAFSAIAGMMVSITEKNG